MLFRTLLDIMNILLPLALLFLFHLQSVFAINASSVISPVSPSIPSNKPYHVAVYGGSFTDGVGTECKDSKQCAWPSKLENILREQHGLDIVIDNLAHAGTTLSGLFPTLVGSLMADHLRFPYDLFIINYSANHHALIGGRRPPSNPRKSVTMSRAEEVLCGTESFVRIVKCLNTEKSIDKPPPRIIFIEEGNRKVWPHMLLSKLYNIPLFDSKSILTADPHVSSSMHMLFAEEIASHWNMLIGNGNDESFKSSYEESTSKTENILSKMTNRSNTSIWSNGLSRQNNNQNEIASNWNTLMGDGNDESIESSYEESTSKKGKQISKMANRSKTNTNIRSRQKNSQNTRQRNNQNTRQNNNQNAKQQINQKNKKNQGGRRLSENKGCAGNGVQLLREQSNSNNPSWCPKNRERPVVSSSCCDSKIMKDGFPYCSKPLFVQSGYDLKPIINDNNNDINLRPVNSDNDFDKQEALDDFIGGAIISNHHSNASLLHDATGSFISSSDGSGNGGGGDGSGSGGWHVYEDKPGKPGLIIDLTEHDGYDDDTKKLMERKTSKIKTKTLDRSTMRRVKFNIPLSKNGVITFTYLKSYVNKMGRVLAWLDAESPKAAFNVALLDGLWSVKFSLSHSQTWAPNKKKTKQTAGQFYDHYKAGNHTLHMMLMRPIHDIEEYPGLTVKPRVGNSFETTDDHQKEKGNKFKLIALNSC